MSARFDAATDMLTSTVGMPTGSFTVICWTNRANDRNVKTAFWGLDNGGAGNLGLYLGTDTNNDALVAYSDKAAPNDFIIGQSMVAGGAWFPTALVVEGATWTLHTNYYEHAESMVSTTSTREAIESTIGPWTKLTVGGLADSAGAWTDGRVANFKMYDAALTLPEIVAELESLRPIRTKDLNRACPLLFDGRDISGNGRHFTAGSTAVTYEQHQTVAMEDTYYKQVDLDLPKLWLRFDAGNLANWQGGAAATQVGGVTNVNSLLSDRKANSAKDFNGTNGRITYPDAADLRMTDFFTIEAWIEVDAFATGAYPANVQYFVSKRNAAGTQGYGFSMWGGDLTFYCNDGGGSYNLFSGVPAHPGKVYHLVGVRKGDLLRFYVNGKLCQEQKSAGVLASMDGDLSLGSNSAGTAPFFDGRMDEVAIYNTDLTAQQVAEHYFAGMTTNTLSKDLFSLATARDLPLIHARYERGWQYDLAGGAEPTLSNGAAVAAPSVVPAVGPAGQALLLDGVNDFSTIPSRTEPAASGSYSADVWFKPSRVTGTQTILHRPGSYSLQLIGTSLRAAITVGGTGGGTFEIVIPDAVVAGETYHVAIERVSNNFWGHRGRVWINGFFRGDVVIPNDTTNDFSASPIYLGCRAGTSEFFQGSISDFCFFNRMMGNRLHQDRYFKGLGNQPPQVPYYFSRMDDFVDTPPGPHWHPKWADWRGRPGYRYSWDGLLNLELLNAPYSTNSITLMGAEGMREIAPSANVDVRVFIRPPELANLEGTVQLTLRSQGDMDPAQPWYPLTGYVFGVSRTAANVLNISILRRLRGAGAIVAGNVSIPIALWGPMFIRARAHGGLMQMKVWKAGDPEPVAWMNAGTDPDPLPAGYLTISSTNANDTTYRTYQVDDVNIQAIGADQTMHVDGIERVIRRFNNNGLFETPRLHEITALKAYDAIQGESANNVVTKQTYLWTPNMRSCVRGRLLVAAVTIDKTGTGSPKCSSGWTMQSSYFGTSVGQIVATRIADGTYHDRRCVFQWGTGQWATTAIAEIDLMNPIVDAVVTQPDPPSDANSTTITANAGVATGYGLGVGVISSDTRSGGNQVTNWSNGYANKIFGAGVNPALDIGLKSLAPGDPTETTVSYTPSDSDQRVLTILRIRES